MTPDVPHYAVPLRIVNGRFALVEQDTDEEISQNVEVIVRTPVGARLDLPDFGIPDQAFVQGGIDADAVQAAIEEWEDRAHPLLVRDSSLLADAIDQATLTANGEDEQDG